ncbi:hypothetical protein B0T26DRAFT_619641, partial [Lasiosphaeria miniovina]
LPKNWPAQIPYLTGPLYSPRLTAAHLAAIRTRPLPPAETDTDIVVGTFEIPRGLKPGPSAAVRITPITDPSHPAHGQCGLFAVRDLKPGELVVPYFGEVHVGSGPDAISEGEDEHAASDYDLWLDRDGNVAVDAARAGNEARFINDYRGVPVSSGASSYSSSRPAEGLGGLTRARPNAEFRAVWDPRLCQCRGEMTMAVFVLPAGKKKRQRKDGTQGGIAKGEEVLVSYGKGFWGE